MVSAREAASLKAGITWRKLKAFRDRRDGLKFTGDLLSYEFERKIKKEPVLEGGKPVDREYLEKNSNLMWSGKAAYITGSTLSVDFGGVGFFAYVALNTNLAAAAGVIGAVCTAWLVIKKPDLSMMLNGAIAALVAITAACAFVAPWAAIVIGFVAGVIVVLGVLAIERIRIDDPIGAIAAHGMAGVWGTLSLGFLALPGQAESLATGTGGLFYTGSFHQLGTQALGLLAVGAFTFTTSFVVLWAMKRTFGIRTDPDVETAGLDVSEHGMWGYPEFYIPVPGGYGTETHGHLRLPQPAAVAPAVAHHATALPEMP
jgi:Amt family ammonium transporter